MSAHAWLITKAKKVIEPTLTIKEEEEIAYHGIAFNSDWLKDLHQSRKGNTWYSVLELNYRDEYCFFKNGFPDEALKADKILT